MSKSPASEASLFDIRPPEIGRNPVEATISELKVVTFRPSSILRDRVNQATPISDRPRASRNTDDSSIVFHKQLIGPDIETLGDPLDIVDGYVALATLNAAKIRTIHFDLEGKVLLTYAPRPTVSADIRRQDISKRARMRTFHGA